MKGADTVMSKLVEFNDWLEEECGNMAREGLRTLVVAKRNLTPEEYTDFEVMFSTQNFFFIVCFLQKSFMPFLIVRQVSVFI